MALHLIGGKPLPEQISTYHQFDPQEPILVKFESKCKILLSVYKSMNAWVHLAAAALDIKLPAHIMGLAREGHLQGALLLTWINLNPGMDM